MRIVVGVWVWVCGQDINTSRVLKHASIRCFTSVLIRGAIVNTVVPNIVITGDPS